jgi:predicted nucleic acid-binding protein
MRIYLDLCCFNRPFDDQSQLIVRLQTEAKLYIQEAIREGRYTLVWSAVLDLENEANPDVRRRQTIADWRRLACVDMDASTDIERLANELAGKGIKPMDALHVASAINAGADWMLTTDLALSRKMQSDERIRVVDPVDFIRTIERDKDENGL